MVFVKQLASGGQTRQFTIEHGTTAGWIAREGDGCVPLKTSHIRDWRQVEAVMAMFEHKASALRQEGWTEI